MKLTISIPITEDMPALTETDRITYPSLTATMIPTQSNAGGHPLYEFTGEEAELRAWLVNEYGLTNAEATAVMWHTETDRN
jgi:hypothetical protein